MYGECDSMIKPFYMLSGQIDLVKETKPFKLDEKVYVEKTYMDENGDRAIVINRKEQ